MNIKRIVPDALTCCNLLCGAASVFMATQGAFLYAFLLILLGAFFDFFDGMSARILNVPSPIGIQLDSLADDITFGLAPAMSLFCWLLPAIGWWAAPALLMAAAAALRLAKFNVDERQHSSFIGLATPPNAIFWASIACMPYAMLAGWMPWVLLAMSLFSCWLMNAEIPMFSFKMKGGAGWKGHEIQYSYLIGCVLLIAFCVIKACIHAHYELIVFAGAACVLWYVALNLLLYIFNKK